MYFEVIEDQKTEGSKSIHIHSEDNSGRLAVNTVFYGLDYSKNYILRMQVKTENLQGTGFFARAQIGQKGNKDLPEGSKVKGTND